MQIPIRKLLLLTSACLIFFCQIAYASIDAGHLVISQIQITGGAGFTTNDFVEIFNPTSQDIDLKGYRLVKRTQTGSTDTLLKSWTDTTIIKAGGFYLWANSNFTDIAIPADVTTSGSISDGNGVALRNGLNDTGTIIDSVAWGNATNGFVEGTVFATNPQANQAMVRIQDTDNNAADFSILDSSPRNSSSVDSVTPPAASSPPPVIDPPAETNPPPSVPNPPPPPPPPVPSPPPPPQSSGGGSSAPTYSNAVKISEFLVNPDGPDSGEEWIEIFSVNDVDLSGWILDDESKTGTVGSSAYVFPAGTRILANGYLAIDLPEENFVMDNTGGDSVRLIWPNKQVANQVDYKDTAPIDTSYVRKSDNTFVWTSLLTKGSANQFDPPAPKAEKTSVESAKIPSKELPKELPKVVISELFPEPARKSNQEEFIELLNKGDTDADLTGYKISDKSSSYNLNAKLAAGEYLVITKSESNISLNNAGSETVSLTSPTAEIIDSVSYEDAPKEQSYNLMADGTYVWSSSLTQGLENKIAAVKTASTVKVAVAENSSGQLIDSEVKPAETVSLADEPIGQVSAATVSDVQPPNSEKNLWPWMIGSFAVNLLFCYSLIRLMVK